MLLYCCQAALSLTLSLSLSLSFALSFSAAKEVAAAWPASGFPRQARHDARENAQTNYHQIIPFLPVKFFEIS
jgi:hypothetical protein